jgi:hypothetical protein
MTDWLFVFYFLAAISFPAEALSHRLAGVAETLWAARAGETEESTRFQSALSIFSLRVIRLSLVVLLGFFTVSGARITMLTVSNPAKSAEWQLAKPDMDAILRRLQQPPFAVLPKDPSAFPIYNNWKKGLNEQPGQYVVLVQRFYYSYYIPAGKLPPRSRPPVQKPYARTVVILPPFDFTISGEIPLDFSDRPLIFVGVVSAKADTKQPLLRPQVDGLAVIPFDAHKRPDFTRAVCSPTLVLPPSA